MKECYIVGAGEFFGSIHPCEEDLVIAADGGVRYLLSKGIIPDVIVGDFDSLSENEDENNAFLTEAMGRVKNCIEKTASESLCEINGKQVEIFRHPIMKDETDMYLAYEIGREKGYTDFKLYGGVGGREDHTFANYCLLLRAKNDKNDLVLIGNNTKTFVIKNEKKEVTGECGATLSVFAFGAAAKGVSIKGLKYEADDVTLDAACPLGVSNSFLWEGKGEISVSDGALLVIAYDR